MPGRRLYTRLHLLLGLTAGFVLVLLGLTGSALVFRGELDAALNPGLYATGDRPAAPLPQVYAAARAAHGASEPDRWRLPRDARSPHVLHFADGHEVFVAPDARVLGERDGEATVVERLFALHRRLAAGDVGELLVCLAAWATLVLLISGLAVRLRLPPKGVARPQRLAWIARHQVIGLLAGVPLALAAVTGLVMMDKPMAARLFALPLGNSSEARAQESAKPPRSRSATDAPSLAPERIVALAAARLPEARLVGLRWPKTPRDAWRVDLKQPGEVHPNGRTMLYLDRADGQALALVEPQARSLAWQAAYVYAFPLHTGELGGDAHRWLIALGGFAPLGLVATGLAMRRARRQPPRRAPAASPLSASPLSAPPLSAPPLPTPPLAASSEPSTAV